MARSDDNNIPRPTVAGVLMATRDPRAWLPNTYIQAVSYRGTDIRPDAEGAAYQLDAADVSGPLDFQVVEACRFVVRNMKVAAFKEQGRVGQAPVRYDGDLRGHCQRCRPSGLFDPRIEDQVAYV